MGGAGADIYIGVQGRLLTCMGTNVSGPPSPPWDLCGSAHKGKNLSWGHYCLMLPPGL